MSKISLQVLAAHSFWDDSGFNFFAGYLQNSYDVFELIYLCQPTKIIDSLKHPFSIKQN